LKWAARKVRKLVAVLASFIILVWLIGLIYFASTLTRVRPEPPSADAIVALTGGDTRLEEAVYLLRLNKGDRLLISGVNPATTLEDIQELVSAPDFLFDCCIDVERAAANTTGNANEAAQWVIDNGYSSLIIVTADYHMPRSLLEFRRAMPDTRLIPYSIQSDRIDIARWWHGRSTIRFMASEYNKYLASLIRVRINAVIS
jgi:uncharacterized SAM-binding protein YcdF (DUF218 family)